MGVSAGSCRMGGSGLQPSAFAWPCLSPAQAKERGHPFLGRLAQTAGRGRCFWTKRQALDKAQESPALSISPDREEFSSPVDAGMFSGKSTGSARSLCSTDGCDVGHRVQARPQIRI